MWQYNYTNYGDELWHHGIKFQKWGVKHGPPYPLSDSTSTAIKSGKSVSESSGGSGSDSESKRTTNGSSDSKNSRPTKSVKDMTDKELNDAINRLNNEKRYRDLQNELNGTGTNKKQNNQTQKKVGLGKKLVNTVSKIAYDSVTKAATNVGKQWLTYELGTAINKHYGKNIINMNNESNENKKKKGNS